MYSRLGSVDSFEVRKQPATTLSHHLGTHFLDEEKHLSATGYPYLERQKRRHDFFRACVTELENFCQDLSVKGPANLLALMRDWLLNHILEPDRA